MNLYHKVLFDSDIDIRIIRNSIKKIMKEGLIPRVPDEWKGLLPLDWQTKSIVWLTEWNDTFTKEKGWLQIDTKQLNAKNLLKLKLTDVNWWVYSGLILPKAIKRIKDKLI